MTDSQTDKLESEIRYLKQLLDENGIPYDYQAYHERTQDLVGKIQFPELTPEHAIQFYSYFRGRKDVYVKRGRKGGYYTQCKNFWKPGLCPKKNGEKIKCQDCPGEDYIVLNTKAILAHLKGDKADGSDVIGLYPLFPDGTCWFLVFDFDNHDEDAATNKDWQQEVDALRNICLSLGIDALVECSPLRSRRPCMDLLQRSDPGNNSPEIWRSASRQGRRIREFKEFPILRQDDADAGFPSGREVGKLDCSPVAGAGSEEGQQRFRG